MRLPPGVRRGMRASVSALAIATLALSGLLLAPAPQPARAALIATGVNDRQTVKHDRTTVIPAPGVLGNDLNLLGGTTASLVSGVSHGTLVLRSDGGYTYTPAAGYLGTDTFRYRPSGLLSTAATVTITIINTTPVARPDAYSGANRATITVAAPGVMSNDTDADADVLVAELVGGVSGSLDLDSNGGFRYTPGGGFSGTVTFSYRVSDGLAWSAATTVTLTIAAPTPTPAPTPTAPPTPTATPAPTATPTATPIVPVPTPSASLPLPSIPLPSHPGPSLPLPSLPQPSGTASATASPNASPGATASPTSSAADAFGRPGGGPTPSAPAGGAPSSGSGTGGGGGGSSEAPSTGGSTTTGGGDPESRLPSIGFDQRRIDLSGASVGLFAGIEIWAVPAATIALPGLLVLLWVALQSVGAIAWMPAVRRLKGGGPARPRARPRSLA